MIDLKFRKWQSGRRFEQQRTGALQYRTVYAPTYAVGSDTTWYPNVQIGVTLLSDGCVAVTAATVVKIFTYDPKTQRFEYKSNYQTDSAHAGGVMYNPTQVIQMVGGRLLVVDFSRNSVVILNYDPVTHALTYNTDYGYSPSLFTYPYGAAVLPSGRIAVTDMGSNSVHILNYNPASGELSPLAVHGPGYLALNAPLAVCTLPDGNVAIGTNDAIIVCGFNPVTNGFTYKSQISVNAGVLGITILPDGRILATVGKSVRIMGYDVSTGQITATGFDSGAYSTDLGKFADPHGAVVLPDSRIYVAEHSSTRMQIFDYI